MSGCTYRASQENETVRPSGLQSLYLPRYSYLRTILRGVYRFADVCVNDATVALLHIPVGAGGEISIEIVVVEPPDLSMDGHFSLPPITWSPPLVASNALQLA